MRTLAIVVLGIFLASCDGQKPNQKPASSGRTDLVSVIGENRSSAISAVEEAKKWPEASPNLPGAKRRYADAKAANEGLITALQDAVRQGRNPDTQTFHQKADNARVATKTVVDYVYAGPSGSPAFRVAPVAAIATAEVIINAAMKFYEAYQKHSREQRENDAKQLDELKWPSWDNVK
jgi:hypothetical protein